MSDADHAKRALAQHARTARVWGADAVPVSRKKRKAQAGADEAIVEPAPRAKAASLNDGPALFGAAAHPAKADEKPTDRAKAQRELDELRARYEREAPHKDFVTSFNKIVFGEGDPCASVMFIGEAPGEEEDKTGRPFVGRAGQQLDKQIAAMGLKREDVYIANVLKTRPPNNATPTPDEARACAPYLFEQIRIVHPLAIVTLGLPATRLILETDASMGRLRGIWSEFIDPAGRAVPVMPTYHPAFLLRAYTPENRAKVWSDLQKVMARLGLKAPAKAAAGH